jgi:hypothetical protein
MRQHVIPTSALLIFGAAGLAAALGAGGAPAAGPEEGTRPNTAEATPEKSPEEDPYAGLTPYVGDIHAHTGLAVYRVLMPEDPHSIGTPAEVLDAAESRGLDFIVITDHSNNLNDPRGVAWRRENDATFTLPDGRVTASEWENLQSAVATRNKPGRFVVMIGIEYTHGDTETAHPGHQAGIFPTASLPRYCSNFPHNVGDCLTHQDFYRFVEEQGGVAVMAHPCSIVTWGSSDWSEIHPVLNSMELMSGKCEEGESGYNHVLKRLGLRIGARGSSDSHHYEVGSNDKTICFAAELTRKALLDAMKKNLCYFVDRFPVTLEFSINGVPMGSEVVDEGAGLVVRATAHSDWDTDFDHMELIHNGEVALYVICEDWEYDDCALSTYILSETEGYYYVRLSSRTDRRIAISSPIWVRSGN